MAEKKSEKLWSFSFQQVIQSTIGIYFSCHSFPKHENMALFTSGPCVSAVRRTKALPELLPCRSFPSEPKNHKEWKYNKVITGLLLLMKTHRKTNSLHSERQRDKYKINVQSTDEKIQILENKFLDRDIIYLKKINCRRFFFSRFFPFILSGALPLICFQISNYYWYFWSNYIFILIHVQIKWFKFSRYLLSLFIGREK